ncbi:fatty acid desaturase family protein [Xanthomonas oryzae pv. oryzae]|uniref:RtxC n=3 Tax=Xanthomonas oryzae TaxID=347 RepID=Q5H328_XANOR|nr:fatty acid desaturase family protein [Xanthomonas oryzae]AAW74643.1 RtxC [Xanthomonas oryzae pv. oryzae KACC 10331]MDI9072184.1 fatty acid desaturase family protein [Xanthomonas oryzae pv. oryzae]MDI9078202.1 fatty acid desaturase family protein [Xanthomonas oryzae pv. oryzae]MDI9105592.1 fatty acid desaturase family protein [Xanthomonas oryzae pv. oryzae]MDI9913144.1 fatty acid desaturase family protein [Xanthomonas oryzae pv. oryzae]
MADRLEKHHMKKKQTWSLRNKRFERFEFSSEIMRELAGLRADNITGTLYIIKDYTIMAACAVATVRVSWWLYPLALLIIGAHQRGLTTISHDAAHRILAKNRLLNNVLGTIFAAYPIFQRHWAYRVSHVYLHHPHLGDPEQDPDLKFFVKSGVYTVRDPREYKSFIVWKSIFGGATLRYLSYLWSNRFFVLGGKERIVDKRDVLIDSYGFSAFWIAVIVGFTSANALHLLVLFWLIPYFTTFQVLGWFTELAEHSPMCESEVKNVYLTRNRKGGLIERLLFGVNYDEYHLEHHLSPAVPFWLLKKAQKIRMRDPTYADIANSWGGIFFSGPEGQPSVISQLLERNRRLYEIGPRK